MAFVFSDRIKGIARKFPSVGFDIVSARGDGIDAESAARLGDERKLTRDAVNLFVADKAEAEVARIVKDRAAARKSARKKNAVLLHFFEIALGARILIFAYNDGRCVLPEKKYLSTLSDIRC